MSRDRVHVALACAALNYLPACACDIQSACLQAPSSDKHYVVCGSDFGLDNFGKHATIVRALCGLKSSGADYWRHVRSAMEDMVFSS